MRIISSIIILLLWSGVCLLSYGNENSIPFNGFIEARVASRTNSDPYEKKQNLGEIRLQLENETEFENFTVKFVSDFVYDWIAENSQTDLETGDGFIDLRQANIIFSPLDNTDIKIGRQILTWGTGDLIFINDLFSKDWVALLVGRDSEYFKAPTDAIKISTFFSAFNVDLVYTPTFTSDRFVDGDRISFYDRNLKSQRGLQNSLQVNKPNEAFHDDELSARFYRTLGAYETALYVYHGFWKSPAGINMPDNRAIFPKLRVVGASVRGPVSNGIGNIEIGYYNSADSSGTDPLVRNSEIRFLLGYEQELATELTGSFQYYIERMLDYEEYVSNLPVNALEDNKYRRIITARITKLLLQQNLKFSVFNYYSPTDQDGYLRIIANYKYSDDTIFEAGVNHFYGKYPHTFFSQFENNSNIYLSARYEF